MDISATVPFNGSLLERCERERADEPWIKQLYESDAARFLAFDDLKAAMRTHEGLTPAYMRRLEGLFGAQDDAEVLFLGMRGAEAIFAGVITDQRAAQMTENGDTFIDVRTIAMQMHGPDLAIVGHARSMLSWHGKNQFCGVCGSKTVMKRGGAVRQCTNPNCGAEYYPRNDPVVIMLAHRGDQCLVGRQHRFPPKMYSALAGFLEHGESLEEAVRREMLEESGIEVGAVEYIASQPWPFEQSIMIGCLADAISTDIIIDEEELEAARWVSAAEVKAALAGDMAAPISVPPDMAIAHHLMKHWAKRF